MGCAWRCILKIEYYQIGIALFKYFAAHFICRYATIEHLRENKSQVLEGLASADSKPPNSWLTMCCNSTKTGKNSEKADDLKAKSMPSRRDWRYDEERPRSSFFARSKWRPIKMPIKKHSRPSWALEENSSKALYLIPNVPHTKGARRLNARTKLERASAWSNSNAWARMHCHIGELIKSSTS